MTAKDLLIRETEDEYGVLRRALVGLSDADLRRPWCGRWGVREILAHIAGWQRELAPALERLARGERPIPEGVRYDRFDDWNARFVSARRGLTVEGVRAELDATHRALVAAAERVPERRFAPGKTAATLLVGVGPGHYREHTGEIRAWRRRAGL